MIVKYYLYRFDGGSELEIPGAYKEGEPLGKAKQPHYIDIHDDQFAAKIRELCHTFAVMIRPPMDDFSRYSIWLDRLPNRFQQR